MTELEVDAKVDRLARLAHARDVAGVLISLQPNFAWLSGGQSNRIDGSTESGAGHLLITRDARRYIVANAIEMPRLHDEALVGLGFEPFEYPWTRDHEDPAAAARVAAAALGGVVGSDAPLPGILALDEDVATLRTPLTDAEVDRYRRFGRDIGSAIGTLLRSLQPGRAEVEVAQQVNAVVGHLGARAVVTLVAGDDRIARFRHPVPTQARWTRTLLVGLCAEREGLVVALSRIIAARRVDDVLDERTRATAMVFGRLVGVTQPGITAVSLFAEAASAYRDVGFAGEEARHHQGGAIGYRSRDWIAHPGSSQVVQHRQAFAWNPSITGTKVEDTALVVDGEVEMISSSPDWPTLSVAAGAHTIDAPGILLL